MYPVYLPSSLQYLMPMFTWRYPNTVQKCLYLTFDDGPTPIVTEWVLQQLAQYQAKASFFCLGQKAFENPYILAQIRAAGHLIGNHGYAHLNGWKTPTQVYIDDIKRAAQVLNTPFFRPPYGKISPMQAWRIRQQPSILQPNTVPPQQTKIVLWQLLCGDFDAQISPEKCAANILRHTHNGTIIVFHDSWQAFPRLQVALPTTLRYFSQLGYRFKACY